MEWVGRAATHHTRLPRAASNLALYTFRDGASTMYLSVPEPHHFNMLQPETAHLTSIYSLVDISYIPNGRRYYFSGHALQISQR